MTPAADEVEALIRRKLFSAADNGSAPVSWEDMRKIDDAFASLRQQLEQERQLSSTLNAACDLLGSELLAERRKLEQARAALRKYGGHKEECDKLHASSQEWPVCSCGFDAHLSQEGAKGEG